MSSKDLVSYEGSSSTTATLKDRETQTSRVYDLSYSSIKSSPSRPLPQNIENTAPPKNPKGKVFEFCEIIQDPNDPDSVTLIREKFSEEVITTTPKGSLFEKPTANKYKYSREVIQPYSKDFCTACPSYVPPRKRDDSSCKPCPPTPPSQSCCKPNPPTKPCSPDEPSQITLSSEPSQPTPPSQHNQTDTEENCINQSLKDRINPSVSAMDTDDKCKMHCKTTFINPQESAAKNPCNTPCKNPCQDKVSQTKLNCDKPKPPQCEKCDKVDEKKLKCCISSCIKDSVQAVKKGSAVCINEIEKVIGVKHAETCEEKPTYYVLEKPRCPSYAGKLDSPNGPPTKSCVQEFMDSQTQTVASIQCALKDFMGIVCTKTKDAIEVIRTESCKQLNTDTENKKDPKKCSFVESFTSLSDKVIQEFNNRDIRTGVESIEKIVVDEAHEVMDKVSSIVSSTISLLQEGNFDKIVDDALDAKFNKSSPHDRPGSYKPPEQVAQDHEPSRNANMFTTIKTKLFSIFGQKDSNHDLEDEDEDDELSAEKYFDKYCDQ